MFVMEKRGINEIVTTVLITLLVISLVAIVFSFVRAPIQQTGTSLTGSQACLKMDMQAVSCNKVTGAVIYKFAGGDATVQGVKVAIKTSAGTSLVSEGLSPALLATQTVTINPAPNTATEASVAAVLLISGQNYTCSESPVKATCA